MKFFNKMISAVAAVAMLATMAVMPAVHADAPTLTAVATPAADQTYVDIAISYSGIVEGQKSSGLSLLFDKELFAVSESVTGTKLKKGTVAGWSTALDDDQKDGGTVSFKQNESSVEFGYSTQETDAEFLLHSSCDGFVCMRFSVIGGASSSVWTDGYEFEFGDVSIGTLKNYEGTLNVVTAKIEAAGASYQLNTKYDDDVEVDTGVSAFGTVKSVPSLAAGTVSLSGTASLVGGGTRKLTKTITGLPKISGPVNVGVVITFDKDIYSGITLD